MVCLVKIVEAVPSRGLFRAHCEPSLSTLLLPVPKEEGEDSGSDPLAPGVAGPRRAREHRDPEVVLLQVVLPGLVESAPLR